MASEGPLFVGLGATVAGPDGNWSNPTSIYLDNGVFATLGSAGVSDYLSATMSGAVTAFTIADGSTIDGIEVLVEAKVVTSGTLDELSLTKDASTPVGADAISSPLTLTTSEVVYTYGSPTDLWGTTWTPTEIKASTFGALLKGTRVTGAVSVDYIQIKVYYTAAGGGATAFPKRQLLLGVG